MKSVLCKNEKFYVYFSDWNLLSTASPSIDAWLNPVDRLKTAASSCLENYHRRVGAVMASLMSDSMDLAAENFLKMSKYGKLTPLSRYYDIRRDLTYRVTKMESFFAEL